MKRVDCQQRFVCKMINPNLENDEIEDLSNLYDNINAKYEMNGLYYRNYRHGSYKLIVEPLKNEENDIFEHLALEVHNFNNQDYIIKRDDQYEKDEWRERFCEKVNGVYIYSHEKFLKNHQYIKCQFGGKKTWLEFLGINDRNIELALTETEIKNKNLWFNITNMFNY